MRGRGSVLCFLCLVGCGSARHTKLASDLAVPPIEDRSVVLREQGPYGQVTLRRNPKGGLFYRVDRRPTPTDPHPEPVIVEDKPADPLMTLVRAYAPRARRAMVYGYNTGTLTRALERTGINVDVIERDPAVARLIRGPFQFRGRIFALEDRTPANAPNAYDVVVHDSYWPEEEESSGLPQVEAPFVFYRVSRNKSQWQPPQENRQYLHLFRTLEDGTIEQIGAFNKNGPPSFDASELPYWPPFLTLKAEDRQPNVDKRASALGYLSTSEDGEMFVSLPYVTHAAKVVLDAKDVTLRQRLEGLAKSASTVKSTTLEPLLGTGPDATASKAYPIFPSSVIVRVSGAARLQRHSNDGWIFSMNVEGIDLVLDRVTWDTVKVPFVSALAQATRAFKSDDAARATSAVHSACATLRSIVSGLTSKPVPVDTFAWLRSTCDFDARLTRVMTTGGGTSDAFYEQFPHEIWTRAPNPSIEREVLESELLVAWRAMTLKRLLRTVRDRTLPLMTRKNAGLYYLSFTDHGPDYPTAVDREVQAIAYRRL